MEQSQMMQLALWVLSAYVFLLFAGWWGYLVSKGGTASSLYKITCFMFLGLFATHLGAWYMYELVLSGYNPISVLDKNCWHMKGYFELVPIILYAVHITNRIISGDSEHDRRSGDI